MIKFMRRKMAPEAAIPLPFWGRMGLLLALILVILPHTLRLPWAVTLFSGAIIAWRLLKEYRGWPLPPPLLRIGLTLLAVVLVVQQFHSLIGRLPGAALLIIMLSLKLMELRSLRDAIVIIAISYFLVVVGFLFDQSMLVGGYLFAVVFALTLALLLLNHPAASREHLLIHGRGAAKLLLQALPIMVLLFLLFPRLNAPLWSLPDDRGVAQTGLSDFMELGNITELVDDNSIAFRVDFEPGQRVNAAELYWRVMVLWQSDGSRWQQLDGWLLQQALNSEARLQPQRQTVSYTLTLQPHQQQWLPLLDRPTTLPELEQPLQIRGDFQLQLQKPLTKTVRYRATAVTDYRDLALPEWAWRAGLQLPEEAHPRTQELVAQWQQQGLTEAALVEQALTYFREQPFWYSRRPTPLTEDRIDQFLFETQNGFCEHYAAAFVTLMRLADIPARVVTGYQGGELNPMGNYLMVRQADAHAWAEVWLEESGWIRVDPTAVIPSERIEYQGDNMRFDSVEPKPTRTVDIDWLVSGWRLVRNSFDLVNHSWNRWVVGFNQQRQRELLQQLGLAAWSLQRVMLTTLVLLALVVGWMALLLLWRRRRIAPAVRQWQRLTRATQRYGITPLAGETPTRFALRLQQRWPALSGDIGAVVEAYEQCRYNPDSPPERYLELVAAVSRFKSRL
ncbi:DUF3488 domain-containing protein [Ectothiorhodospiraceae bacterium BW-2]|nr:DUF3488 domain-containing protein [Ectothiorhodospiraceae bacterium BW-2]